MPTGTIHVFSVSTATGGLAEVPGSPFSAGLTPQSLAADPTGRFLYVANLQSQDITGFSIDPASGTLSELPGSNVPIGAAPVAMGIDPTGRFLYIFATSLVNTSEVEALYEYTIDGASGVLTPVPGPPPVFASGFGNLVTSIAFSPAGNVAYLGQQGSGQIPQPVLVCAVDFSTGSLTQTGSQTVAAGGISELAVAPNGGFLYSVDAIANLADAFQIAAGGGQLAELGGSPYATGSAPNSVIVHPSGNYAYAVNGNQAFQTTLPPSQYTGSVSAFAVLPGAGTLAAVDGSPYSAGINPQSVVVDPSGTFLYTAATLYTSGFTGFAQIEGFSINPATGALTPFAAIPWTDAAPSIAGALVISAAPKTALNPVPAISSLSPPSALATNSTFTLQVNGSNFVPGSTVYYGGQPRTTTFVSFTELTAAILASDVNNGGADVVLVFNPLPGGGASASIAFPVFNPVPQIAFVNPATLPANATQSAPGIVGSNFVLSSVVNFNGTPLTTSYVGSTLLTALIPATDLTTAGSGNITVTNPAPGGGTSNAVTLTIVPPVTPPVVTSISPASAVVGGPAFTLTVNGSGFVSGSQITFNLNNVSTTFVNSTQLTAAIPASAIHISGNFPVVVNNPDGSASTPVTFPVAPLVAGVSPNSVMGFSPVMLTVQGANFDSGAVVFDSNQALQTTFVSPTQLTAVFPQSELLLPGAHTILVKNGQGAILGTVSLQVVNPQFQFSTNSGGLLIPFGTVNVGSSSIGAVTITNLGNAGLTLDSFAISGTNNSYFTIGSSGTNCPLSGGVLAPQGSCTTAVQFAPQTSGLWSASLIATFETPASPVTFQLSGTGTVLLAATVSPTSLNFGAQNVGSSSAPQVVTLTNSGSTALAISNIGVTSGFTQSNDCPASLMPGPPCTINVTFSPAVAGSNSGTLTITSSDGGSPHVVQLAAANFTISPSTGSTTSATVTAGNPATYQMSLSPQVFTGTVNLTCTEPVAIPYTNCGVSPTQANLSGSAAVPVTVTVTTTARGGILNLEGVRRLPPRRIRVLRFPMALSFLLIALCAAAGAALGAKRRPIPVFLGSACLLILLALGCGATGYSGGSGGSGTGGSGAGGGTAGTPAGTYQLIVTASSSGVTRTTTLTLIVQ